MSVLPVCREKYYELLKKEMEKKDVFMVSTNTWPYWVKAKNILQDEKIEANELNLDAYSQEERLEFGHCIYGSLPSRFVPFIFIKGSPLGSYSELLNAQKTGQLSQFATKSDGEFL